MSHGSPIPQQVPLERGGTTVGGSTPDTSDFIPVIVNGQVVGYRFGKDFVEKAEFDFLVKNGRFPTDEELGIFSGGGGTTSFASTQAAQTQAEAFQREQDRLSREFQANQDRIALEARAEGNRLAEEAALKRGRLSTLTDLIQSFAASQSQARDTLANLQPDAFRFAAVAGGIAPFGVTPQQGFTEQLQQFASAPVPTADPNASLPSIENAIQGLTGANVPLSPQVFGAAGGARIPAPAPGQSIAVKVGEKGEEVLRITAQGVEVIPLAGGMQEGGAIGFPFEPIPFDANTAFPTLGRTGIFGGFQGFPRATTSGRSGVGPGPRLVRFGDSGTVFAIDPLTGQARGISSLDVFNRSGFSGANVESLGAAAKGGFQFGSSLTEPLGFNPDVLSRLGVDPGLVRFGDDPGVFFRDPRTDALRQFRSAEQFQGLGFDFGNVTALDPASRGGFDFGPGLGQGFQPPISTDTPSPFTRFSVPVIEPTTGTILPNPATVASQLNRLRLTDPATFNLLLNAYETAVTPAGNSAGFGAANVLATIQASLPFGQERTLTGLR